MGRRQKNSESLLSLGEISSEDDSMMATPRVYRPATTPRFHLLDTDRHFMDPQASRPQPPTNPKPRTYVTPYGPITAYAHAGYETPARRELTAPNTSQQLAPRAQALLNTAPGHYTSPYLPVTDYPRGDYAIPARQEPIAPYIPQERRHTSLGSSSNGPAGNNGLSGGRAIAQQPDRSPIKGRIPKRKAAEIQSASPLVVETPPPQARNHDGSRKDGLDSLGSDDLNPPPKKKKLEVGSQENTPSKSTPKNPWKKNTPNLNRGEKCKWADNPSYRNITNRPFRLSIVTPQYLSITLRTTFGNTVNWNRDFAGPPEWNNPLWIKRMNEWWDQIIQRTLKQDPDDSTKRAPRQVWSERERANVVGLARRLLAEGAPRIGPEEIAAITENHNSLWAGTYTRTGERAVYAPTDKPLKRKNKECFTKDVLFRGRSAQSIRAMMKKWPDTSAMMDRADDAKEEDSEDADEGPLDEDAVVGALLTLKGDKKPGIEPRPKRDDDDDEDMGGMGGPGVSGGSGGYVPFALIDAAIAEYPDVAGLLA